MLLQQAWREEHLKPQQHPGLQRHPRDSVEKEKQRKFTQQGSVRLHSNLSVSHISIPGQILEISERERSPSLRRGT